MNKILFASVIGLMIIVAAAAAAPDLSLPASTRSGPQYTADGHLKFPQHYREWIYVSSGLGMNYGPSSSGTPAFTNVFVTPAAYQSFLATGHWPDKTLFVLEEYRASSHGSILQHGQYQSTLEGVEAEVKDESRFPDKWAYFGFGTDRNTASQFPKEACWNCHHHNGAVENTFVQFYPTLLPIAWGKGTVKPGVLAEPQDIR